MTFQVGWRDRFEPPPPEDDRTSDAFRATLDDALETRLFGELVYRAVRHLGARHVLDVGCGVGTPTLEAARAGAARVVGVDLIRENVARAHANILRSRLDGRVSAHHASWRDVVSGRFAIGDVDLVVSNPPYVPGGRGSAVDDGPRGTSILDAIVDGVPGSVRGLALLFGSLSDPLQVIARLQARGFALRELLLEPVPFGRYTSEPATLATLLRLRREGHAWFSDAAPAGGGAPHQYLTMGVVAQREAEPSSSRASAWRARVAALLDTYQRTGRVALDAGAGVRGFERTGRSVGFRRSRSANGRTSACQPQQRTEHWRRDRRRRRGDLEST